MSIAPRIVQLLIHKEDATDKNYFVALTETGRIFYVQRELLALGSPLEWTEIASDLPAIPSSTRFEQILWVSTGKYLLGLKNDGTIWKATNPAADPLVWVEVST